MAAPVDPADRRRGFSLIEVLIALAILGLVILGVVGLFSRSIGVNASGFEYATLSAVARQSVEVLQGQPFAAVADTGGAPVTLPDPTGTNNYTVRYTCIDYFVTTWADVQGTGSPAPAWPTPTAGQAANLKKITLTVESQRELEGRRALTVTMLKVPSGG
jgi:prepilin-type N-terminal cleavage/methylation domain-containing protein